MSNFEKLTNTQILERGKINKQLLRDIDRQKYYLLGIALTPMKCPAHGCEASPSKLEASGRTLDEYNAGSGHDGEYRCPSCGTPLTWHLPFIGAPFWGADNDRAVIPPEPEWDEVAALDPERDTQER